MSIRLTVAVERYPIAGAFTIARGSKTEALVVVATVEDGLHRGRGECVPYARYGETVEGVTAAVAAMAPALAAGLDREALQAAMPAGAARNALDCALWDLEAKRAGLRAWDLAGLTEPRSLTTAFTLSLGEPAAMRDAAAKNADRPLLKVKLGTKDDGARIKAVREGAPSSRLIVDANEGWLADNLQSNLAACAVAGVELIEQPLPAADDAALATITRDVPVCADESLHDRAGLRHLVGRYDAVNIKLDKAGGLTEGMALAQEARALGFGIMVGSMVGTSLGIAPAILVAQGATIVDLDGPLLLARDRQPGLRYEGSVIFPPDSSLWG
jgi:L-alanine-DL-glutamate epimerase-like enolase superfamily enzyme